MTSRANALALDKAGPIAAHRERFELRTGLVYLDGNSLGALPSGVETRIAALLREEWGHGLIPLVEPAAGRQRRLDAALGPGCAADRTAAGGVPGRRTPG